MGCGSSRTQCSENELDKSLQSLFGPCPSNFLPSISWDASQAGIDDRMASLKSSAVQGPMSLRQSLRASVTAPQLSVGKCTLDGFKSLGLGQVCAVLSYIEVLQSKGLTEFCVNSQNDEDIKEIVQYFKQIKLEDNICLAELSKELTQRKVKECAGMRPEYHDKHNLAWENMYINSECMHCEAMIRGNRDWAAHWSMPPGPAVLDVELSVGDGASLCTSMSSSSTAISRRRSMFEDVPAHRFIEYMKYPNITLVKVENSFFVCKQTTPISNVAKRDIAFLQQISHPNILPIEVVVKEGLTYSIYSSYVPCGMLYKPFDSPLQFESIRLHGASILSAMCFLHSHGIYHGNIGFGNVLLNSNGAALIVDVGQLHEKKEYDNIFGFRPPSGVGTAAGDVWSVGVLLYMMSCAQPPFLLSDAAYLAHSDPDWARVPPLLVKVLRPMLQHREGLRATMLDCINDIVFRNNVAPPPKVKIDITAEDTLRAVTEIRPQSGFHSKKSRLFSTESEMAQSDDVDVDVQRAIDYREDNLNLTHKLLTTLPVQVFDLLWLVQLDLSKNKLAEIPAAIDQLTCLTSFIAKNNVLSSLPEEVTKLPVLQVLDVGYNMLRTFPSVPPASALLHVTLDYNKFEEVPVSLEGHEDLEILMLIENPVKKLPCSWKWKDCTLHLNNTPSLIHDSLTSEGRGMIIQWNKIYPDKIEEKVYIGSLRTVQNEELMRGLGVTSVYSVGKGLAVPDPWPASISRELLSVDDSPDVSLIGFFDSAAGHIEQTLRKGNTIIIHCFAGLSRSVTIFCAYLIKCRGMTFKQAISHVKRGRPNANPNLGFRRQLADYEGIVHGMAGEGEGGGEKIRNPHLARRL